MAAITSSNVATAIVKLVAADALPALMGNLVMGNLVNRDYEPSLGQAGGTVYRRVPPRGAGPVAAVYAAGGGGACGANRIGSVGVVSELHLQYRGGHWRDADHGSGG